MAFLGYLYFNKLDTIIHNHQGKERQEDVLKEDGQGVCVTESMEQSPRLRQT